MKKESKNYYLKLEGNNMQKAINTLFGFILLNLVIHVVWNHYDTQSLEKEVIELSIELTKLEIKKLKELNHE